MRYPHREHLQPLLHDLTAVVRAPSSALSDRGGQIRASGAQGLFYADCRVLSEAVLRISGHEPEPVIYAITGPYHAQFVGLARGLGNAVQSNAEGDPRSTGPMVPIGLTEEIRLSAVRVDRVRQMTPDGLAEEIHISSAASTSLPVNVTLDLCCDLAPMGDVRHSLPGAPQPARHVGEELVWSNAAARVHVGGNDAVVDASSARLTWSIEVPAGQTVTLRWRARVNTTEAAVTATRGPVKWTRPEVTAGDHRLSRLLHRSLDDLQALRLADESAPDATFLGAGAPWYLTLFGRDSIWAARMMLPTGTELAADTLRVLARRQGVGIDPTSGEAPGKILHELRYGSVFGARVANGPVAYYGSIDATPLWISLLHDAWRWGMPEAEVAVLLPHLQAALGWLAQHADPDGDGFVEYIGLSGSGLANQGWKDSEDAVRFRDGRQAAGPIALCEVQGYAYQAATHGAALLSAFDLPGADRWEEYAASMARRFRERFWVDGPDGPYPALALDRDKRPVDSLTSNIGHLLGTGLLDERESAHVARALASPALSDTYGLRTMSTSDLGFNAMSYHCGAIWPHDTAIAIRGLVRAGFGEVAAQLTEGVLAAGEVLEYRLPELYCADDTHLGRPTPYPAACRPQAWSAAAAVAIVQATLGLEPDIPAGEVRLNPIVGVLPGGIDVRGLRIAGRPVDVALDSAGRVTTSGLPDTVRIVTDVAPRIPAQSTALAAEAAQAHLS